MTIDPASNFDRHASDLFSVAGRVALVTGGSSGIGAMIAHGLHAAGAEVTVVSRDVPVSGSPFRYIRADLAEREGVEQATGEFLAHRDSPNILVNAAGMHASEPIETHGQDIWDDVLGLNLKQPFHLTQLLLDALRRHALPDRPSTVVNIASSAGLHVPSIENYAYSASKAALTHLTRHMARRLAQDHVTVNAIAPGPVPSRMSADTPPEHLAALARTIPLARLGQAEDFAGATQYLCSRAGRYLAGAVLSVDGGMVAALQAAAGRHLALDRSMARLNVRSRTV